MVNHSYLPVANGAQGTGLGAYSYSLLARLKRRRQLVLLFVVCVTLGSFFWWPQVGDYSLDRLRAHPLSPWNHLDAKPSDDSSTSLRFGLSASTPSSTIATVTQPTGKVEAVAEEKQPAVGVAGFGGGFGGPGGRRPQVFPPSAPRPIKTDPESGLIDIQLDTSATYDVPPTPESDQYALNSSAFPPAYMYGKPYVYPAGANPHLGEIPPHLHAILSAKPLSVRPPRPERAGFEPNATSHTPWTRLLNGSASKAADAMQPHLQPLEKDWRSGKFAGWHPPLVDLAAHLTAEQGGLKKPLPKVQFAFAAPDRHSGRKGDEKREALIRERQRLVKNAFLHSWNGYKQYAWGHDELRPVSKRPNDNFNGWGATIVDALDTLLVLGLPEEYDLARQHVRDIHFHLVAGGSSAYGSSDGRVPVFETAIRYLGGLLAAYDLSGDDMMRDRAEELGQILLPAFETHSGIPLGRIRPGAPGYKSPAGGAVLAEAGSMLLEMTRLWQVTGNRTYFDRVQRTTDWLDYNMTMGGDRLGSLLPLTIYPESEGVNGVYSFGGMADSYYEYLIKEHQLLGGALQYGRMYATSIDDARKWLMRTLSVVPNAPSLMTLGQANGRQFQAKLEHLTCFSGGMLGLGAKLLSRPADLTAARRFTETCWWAYNSTATGIGPEEVMFYRADDADRFEFNSDAEGHMHKGQPRGNPIQGVRYVGHDYRNRPETIESVLYMWRITGDEVWQERGWQMFASWVTHCMTDAGFSSISDVMQVPVYQTDSMESYSFAETFKYYYLLFSPPNLISLDDWVFTTEAHPLRLPKNGAWGQPKAGEFWYPEATHEPPVSSDVYAGGEQGMAGGLTNWQKHIVAANLAALKQREKETNVQELGARMVDLSSSAGQAVVARGIELGNDGATALANALRKLLSITPSASKGVSSPALQGDEECSGFVAAAPNVPALIPDVPGVEFEADGLPIGHPQGFTSPEEIKRRLKEHEEDSEGVILRALQQVREMGLEGKQDLLVKVVRSDGTEVEQVVTVG